MPDAYRKSPYSKGLLYPEIDPPYPLALCVVVWIIGFSIVLASIFGAAALVITVGGAIVSAFIALAIEA